MSIQEAKAGTPAEAQVHWPATHARTQSMCFSLYKGIIGKTVISDEERRADSEKEKCVESG